MQRERRTRTGLLLGTVIGAGVGAGIGGLVASVAAHEGGYPAAGFLLFTGMGAGIGCGLDALINIPRTVYEREGPRVSVAPMVSPHGGGVGVRVTF